MYCTALPFRAILHRLRLRHRLHPGIVVPHLDPERVRDRDPSMLEDDAAQLRVRALQSGIVTCLRNIKKYKKFKSFSVVV